MTLIHHTVTGAGGTPIVFIHGFACGHSDWDAQVAHLSGRHRTIAVDLRGHGLSPGTAAECSIERYGADVAEVMHHLALPPAILMGHSMGCRVAIEAALQAPARTKALILVDGSQFAAAMEASLKERFASAENYAALANALFKDMFTAKSARAAVDAVVARAGRLPRPIGEKLLTDLLRYDTTRLAASLAGLRLPVMAVQATFSNEKRERATLRRGQTTPYLDLLRATIPSVRTEIIEDTGHFPQLDEPARTNALIDAFLATL